MAGKKLLVIALIASFCISFGVCHANGTGNAIQFKFASEEDKTSDNKPQQEVVKNVDDNNKVVNQYSGDKYFRTIYRHVVRTAPSLGQDWAELVANSIVNSCDRYGVDPLLATALFTQESGFNPRALSPTGAMGIAQLMPGTAEAIGLTPSEAWNDPVKNVDAGVRYLAMQLGRFSYTNEWRNTYAIAAYNAGPGALQNGLPPYLETINHVDSIRNIYIQLLNDQDS